MLTVIEEELQDSFTGMKIYSRPAVADQLRRESVKLF